MKKRKAEPLRKKIDGVDVTYEFEGGQTFVSAKCPYCTHRDESIQQQLDLGRAIASRVNTHIRKEHPEYAKLDTPAE